MRRDERVSFFPPDILTLSNKKFHIPYIHRAGEVNDGSDIYVTIYGVSHYRHSSRMREAWR